MKASLAWLNDYLDRPVTADAAADALTRLGFPVEDREEIDLGKGGTDLQLDVEVTSNRGDCLSHVGVARELSVGLGVGLKPPAVELPATAGSAGELTSVAVETPDCHVFTVRVIRGVKVGPSPGWLVDRLTAAGVRSINNVVDVTNFVMLEMGQPLHAYDMSKLAEGRIVVRGAKQGETFVAINHETYKLGEGMLVIADAEKPVGLAGVMGGLNTEVSESTSDVLLESASFDAVAVRRSSRGLKLSSDASYRFERGVDPLGVERASQRAAAMIVELAGGELAEGVVRTGVDEPAVSTVSLRASRCRQLLGEPIELAVMVDALDRLGFGVSVEGEGDAAVIAAKVPSHRLDITREVDLIEEVARVRGLAAVAVSERLAIEVKPPDAAVARRRALTGRLVGLGFFETQTPSLMGPGEAGGFAGGDGAAVGGLWESARADDRLRPSLLPSLLSVRKLNHDRGVTAGGAGVSLFELASVWRKGDGGVGAAGLIESRRLGLLVDAEGGVDGAQAAVGRLRGAIEAVSSGVTVEAGAEAVAGDARWAGVAAAMSPVGVVRRLGTVVGVLGVVKPAVGEAAGLQVAVAEAELDAEALMAEGDTVGGGSLVLTRFPGIERDLSVVVDEAVAWSAIEAAAMSVCGGAGPEQLESLAYVGMYRGKPIAKGRKSVTLRMTFRDPEATLTHEAVDPRVAEVVDALKAKLDAELRG
ncbi:MAG: phenylalanine--tRNA ligase subunit beta [Planctomycetota bacterium]